jgi:hypothetical protein
MGGRGLAASPVRDLPGLLAALPVWLAVEVFLLFLL